MPSKDCQGRKERKKEEGKGREKKRRKGEGRGAKGGKKKGRKGVNGIWFMTPERVLWPLHNGHLCGHASAHVCVPLHVYIHTEENSIVIAGWMFYPITNALEQNKKNIGRIGWFFFFKKKSISLQLTCCVPLWSPLWHIILGKQTNGIDLKDLCLWDIERVTWTGAVEEPGLCHASESFPHGLGLVNPEICNSLPLPS